MNVLGRLALRALGAPAQVRPRLGGLFENPAAGGGDIEVGAPLASGAPMEPPPASPFAASGVPVAAHPPSPGEPPPAPAFERPPLAGAADPRRPEAQPGFDAPADAPASSPNSTAAPIRLVVEKPGEIRTFANALRPETRNSPATPPQPYRPLLPPLSERRADPPSVAQWGEPAGRGGGPADLQISIGRIEVRGEPERRAPEPMRRPGPRLMSLEDYLAKGRRR